MFKRILACLLVLVTLVSYLPPKASAAETQPQIKNDVTMEGTNSFGTLLANTVQNDSQSQSEGENSRICDLQIEGTLATVEYTTDRAAKVVVAIYTEDGATMLGSGVTEVVPEDTQTVVEIQIASMPRYYSAAAYLLDAETNDPLSPVFRTQLYTKVVQDLKNSTVEDYDPERVLNLDNSNTTNFAVFGENTILVQEGSPCQISGGNGVYTVTNADERFLSMKDGDSFAAPQKDGSTLIVKAAKVSVQGDTVTIYEDANADLTDVFDFVKIEGGSTTDNVTYDDSGLDSELSIISEEEFLSQTNDDDEYAIDTYAVDVDERGTYSKDFKTDGEHLTGSFKFGLSASTKAYVTPLYQYISVNFELSLTGKITVKAKYSKDFKIGVFGVPLCAGCYLQITPKVYFNASCALTYKVDWKASIGKEFDSDVGEWKDTSGPAKVKSAADFSGSIYIGIGTEVTLAFVSKKLVNIEIEAQVGATISGKQSAAALPTTPNDSVLHRCAVCIDGEIKASLKISLSYKIFGKEKSIGDFGKSWEIGDFGKSWKLSDFFYCVDENEFGFTKCPHKVYRVKVTTLDSEKNPLTNVPVWLFDKENNPVKFVTRRDEQGDFTEGEIQNTDETGKTVFYLPNGEYLLEAAKDDQRSVQEITVHDGPKDLPIVLSVQSGKAAIQMVPKELTLEERAQEQLRVIYGTNLDVTNACVWSSSDSEVVTVKNGKVTAVGEGRTTVTARYTRNGERHRVSCSITVNGAIAASGKCGDDLTWTLTESGTLTISGSGKMENYDMQFGPPWNSSDVKIRSVVIEPGVTSIGDYALAWWSTLTDVTIPDSVTSIGENAFLSCSKLKRAMIPSGVVSIGESAFSGCSSLTSLTIPSSVTSIGGDAFAWCSGLTDLTISEGVASIGERAFLDCSSLTSVTIPTSLTSISQLSFSGCKALTSVTIPVSVTSIDYGAFAGCTRLRDVYYAGSQSRWDEIEIADNNEPLLSAALHLNSGNFIDSGKCGDDLTWTLTKDGTLTISGTGGMYDYSWGSEQPWFAADIRIWSIVIMPGVTRIGDHAFHFIGGATSATIPDTVTSIGDYAFYACSYLSSVTIPKSVASIGEGVFSFCSGLNNIFVDEENQKYTSVDGVLFNKGKTALIAYPGGRTDAVYSIPDGVTRIENFAFFDCNGLTSVMIPEGVTSIGNSAFRYCSSLTSVVIPEGVTEIEGGTFADCSALTSITIPGGVTSIGSLAFGSSGLTSITIPANVTRITFGAFSGCASLNGIFVNDGNENYTSADGVLFSKDYTTLCTYPAGKENTVYKIPDGVTSIGDYAFNGCDALTSVTIPDSVTSIDSFAFTDCSGLASIVIPEGVKSIEFCVFSGCSSLASITIPESVTEINTNAFDMCDQLKDVYYLGSCEQWKEIYIISDNTVLFDATIHCSDGTIKQGVSTFAEQPDETTETVPTEETVPETTAETVPETIPETTAETTPETTGSSTESTQPQETEETAQSLSTITWFRVPKGAKMEDGAAVRLSAHTGKETVRNGVRSVAFVGLEPGEEYVLIVSLKPGSVQPEDLQYIEQSAADGNGSVSFTYIPRTEVSAITQLYGISAQRSITLNREYLAITMGSLSEPIQATVDPEEWTDDLVWFSENEDVVTVDENGCVTPVSVGTGYVVAKVTHGKYTITARCRVDVTEKVANEEVLGVDLGTKKVTTELYSTDYAKIDILPRLKQNEIALFSFFSAMPADNGSAITGAYLEDETARQFFELRVKDDRQLLLVPTQEALDNAKGVKSSYSSKIVVLVNGVEYHTEDAVTISVKKTMPKLKAANLTFNPFYTEQSQALTITGGTVTKVEGTTPDWLTMDGTKLTLSNAPKSGSASLNLLVYTTEWAIPVNVKASVKLSYKAPRLKLSASSVTLSETDSLGVTLKLTAGKQSLEELNVKSVTLPAGFEDTELNLYTGEIALVPIGEIPTGKQAVRVSFYGTDSVLDLPLRVNKRTPTLRLSKTSVSLNAELGDSMTLKVTATPADLDLAKVTVTNPSEALEVSPVNENGEFTVTVKQGSASKASYALMVQAPTGKAAKLTVKTLAAGQKVTMSLKAAGSIDLTFPEKGVALQPKYRNYAGELENVVYTLALKQGKVTLDAAFDDYLTIGEDGLIRWNGTGSLESGNVCLITMTGELPNGTMLFATAQVRVTQTPVILRLSKASLSLNKRLEEKTQVTVTTSTRGYTLGDVELLVTDNKNVPSDGLTAAYENGLLTLSVNEKTVYGGSYKVQLWVTPKRVTTLMVRIPAEKKSAVTMTARARGGIDVIRDASEVIVTPTYRNCLDGASLKKQVKVTWAQDGRNYSQDVTEDFILTWAQDGTLHVSKVPGKELALTGKYRLEILCEGMEKEAYTALSVKCGTARFTVASVSLYAKDANDMARLTITTTDKTVNTLERVELKDARLKGTYEVLDLGGGQFALCLIPGAKAKTGTVTLNLFCEGNTTAKPSGTVSVKVEIR